MTVSIKPSTARGTVAAPPSKSMAHRLLLAAGLANGISTVAGLADSRDMEATVSCLRALGASVTIDGDTALITGCNPAARPEAILECLESGSTLRFLLPLCLLSDAPATLCGTEKLLSRPLSVYAGICEKQGIAYRQGKTSVTVRGRLQSGDFRFRGDISSQFVTGLLYALPLLSGDSTITLLPPVESRSYIDLTLSALHLFGIEAGWYDESTLSVLGGQAYLPQNVTVEGDWSNAAFWLAAGTIGGGVSVSGLDLSSAQGDRAIMACAAAFGARVGRSGSVASTAPDALRGRTIDVRDIPDLVPPLAAIAANATGTTVIANAGRLRLKESDRLATVTAALRAMGADVDEQPDALVVHGTGPLSGGVVDAANDHRIAMMAAIAGANATGPTTIRGAECVAKSYPRFFEDFRALGGIAEEG